MNTGLDIILIFKSHVYFSILYSDSADNPTTGYKLLSFTPFYPVLCEPHQPDTSFNRETDDLLLHHQFPGLRHKSTVDITYLYNNSDQLKGTERNKALINSIHVTS